MNQINNIMEYLAGINSILMKLDQVPPTENNVKIFAAIYNTINAIQKELSDIAKIMKEHESDNFEIVGEPEFVSAEDLPKDAEVIEMPVEKPSKRSSKVKE